MSKYRVISGPYFPVFSPNTGKYGPEITPYLDTFHAVIPLKKGKEILKICSKFTRENPWQSVRDQMFLKNTFNLK